MSACAQCIILIHLGFGYYPSSIRIMTSGATEATVCILEEDHRSQEATELLARSAGLKTRTYATAEEFLRGLDDTLEAASCLVLGLQLSDMNGLSLLQTLVDDEIAIPVIMVAAEGDVPSCVSAMKLGAVDFLEKPLAQQKMVDRIFEALERWKQTRSSV